MKVRLMLHVNDPQNSYIIVHCNQHLAPPFVFSGFNRQPHCVCMAETHAFFSSNMTACLVRGFWKALYVQSPN